MKIGMVFNGGGGKGAYQIGVMKAILSLGLDRHIQAISGTSVGALNAAFFINGDFQLAERTWLTISPDKILSVKSSSIVNSLSETGFLVDNSRIQRYANALEGYGIFSRKGMLQIMEESINLQKISSSSIPFYTTCVELPSFEKRYFRLNDLPLEHIKTLLLATSAIPVVFPPESLNRKLYIDGGILDNSPVQPLYDEGCDIIIVAALNRYDIIQKKQFANAKIIEIIPQESQGNLFNGTLQFTAKSAKRRIQHGFEDAMRILTPYIQAWKNEQNFYQSAKSIVESHHSFVTDHEINHLQFQQGMESLKNQLKRGH